MARIEILGRSVEITSKVPGVLQSLEAAYGFFETGSGPPDLSYTVFREGSARSLKLARLGGPSTEARDLAHFLRVLDEDLRVEIQKLRPDLYFLHSAVVGVANHAILLVGSPGAGKSTTCWGLCHFGFGFLSDELAPIDLGSLSILPYVRAVHLKNEPPADFPLPAENLKTAGSIHVPLDALPGGVHREPARVAAILFLSGSPGSSEPGLHRLSAAESATRLYANSLNALAHPADGLDAVVRIADNVHAFALTTGDLADTCELIRTRAADLMAP